MQLSIGLAGLILAAGNSTRMGTDKAMLPWPPMQSPAAGSLRTTLLSAALAAFAPFTQISVVVAGRNAEAIAGTVEACGAHLVRNPMPENGQFSSLQLGLRAILDRGCDAAMITPVDCPPLGFASLQHLYDAFLASLTAEIWAVAPEHAGRHGHPLLVGRKLIDAFLEAPITSNARSVLREHTSRVLYLTVPEPLTASGLNTPEDYAAAAKQAASKT